MILYFENDNIRSRFVQELKTEDLLGFNTWRKNVTDAACIPYFVDKLIVDKIIKRTLKLNIGIVRLECLKENLIFCKNI